MCSTNPFQAFAFAKSSSSPPAPPALPASPAKPLHALPANSTKASSDTVQPSNQAHQQQPAAAASDAAAAAAKDTAAEDTAAAAGPRGLAASSAGQTITPSPRMSLQRAAKAPAAAAAAAAQAGQATAKRQRKAYASLTGAPKGLPEKLGSAPLRLILVGHNPSEHAWHTGHYYSNPSNRLWPIIISCGIAPPGVTGPAGDDVMPDAVGVGFTDVGSGQPGTDSSKFTAADFQAWRGAFYERLVRHMQQASDSIGCTCGQCGAPALVAFTGKRHFLELLNMDAAGKPLTGRSKTPTAAVPLGPQPPGCLPPAWPLPAAATEVWVLTSTSGAAPMSNEVRRAPYVALAQRLKELPWPRQVAPKCKEGRE